MSARVTLALAALFAVLAGPDVAGWIAPSGSDPFGWGRLLDLTWRHALLALGGAAPACLLGAAVGLWVARPGGAPLRPLAESMAAAAQAVPPVVVVALAFPALGFGAAPTLLALTLYCLMPVTRAAAAAVDALPAAALEAARAVGMEERDILRGVVLPLVWPAIVPALRTATLLAVATAAVGSLAGADTLGTPVVLGLRTMNAALLLQGAAATAALAFALDGALSLAAGRFNRANRFVQS